MKNKLGLFIVAFVLAFVFSISETNAQSVRLTQDYATKATAKASFTTPTSVGNLVSAQSEEDRVVATGYSATTVVLGGKTYYKLIPPAAAPDYTILPLSSAGKVEECPSQPVRKN